jgi:hypothetical protein
MHRFGPTRADVLGARRRAARRSSRPPRCWHRGCGCGCGCGCGRVYSAENDSSPWRGATVPRAAWVDGRRTPERASRWTFPCPSTKGRALAGGDRVPSILHTRVRRPMAHAATHLERRKPPRQSNEGTKRPPPGGSAVVVVVALLLWLLRLSQTASAKCEAGADRCRCGCGCCCCCCCCCRCRCRCCCRCRCGCCRPPRALLLLLRLGLINNGAGLSRTSARARHCPQDQRQGPLPPVEQASAAAVATDARTQPNPAHRRRRRRRRCRHHHHPESTRARPSSVAWKEEEEEEDDDDEEEEEEEGSGAVISCVVVLVTDATIPPPVGGKARTRVGTSRPRAAPFDLDKCVTSYTAKTFVVN